MTDHKHEAVAQEIEATSAKYAPKPAKTVKAFEAARAEIAKQVKEASQ